MPDNTNGRLKSGNSGIRKMEQTEDPAKPLRLIRHTMKGTNTQNYSLSQLSDTDPHDGFTDYDAVEIDAVEIFDRILLKKRFEQDP